MTAHATGRREGPASEPLGAAAARPGRAALLFGRSLFLPDDLGGNRYPYEAVRRLGERGHPVTVVTPRLHGQFPRLPNVGYRHYRVLRQHPALTHLSNLAGATAALRHERARAYAAALCGSYDVALALGWAGVVPRVPLVFLFHSEFYSEWVQALDRGARALARRALRAYMDAVERRVFGSAARLVAVSEFSARQIRARAPSVADRVRVVPTGVDTEFFTPADDRTAAKRAAGFQPDDLVVLGVGRLVPVKQLDRLVEAFALARSGGLASARLVIAGGGPERSRLERLVGERGLADVVDLAGYCDPLRLRALMQAADVQVCSSAFENFSLAILEGMACGLPVLGTPGGGTPELVGQLDPSLVLSDDRAETMAAAIRELAADRGRLRALGERARQIAATRYDWERVVDRLEEVCREVSVAWS